MTAVLGRNLHATRILALYHHPCHDGVFAALALHRFYSRQRVPIVWHPHTTFAPLSAEDLKIKPSDVVYLLDFAGKPGFVEELVRQQPQRIVVLDHHKTSEKDLSRPELKSIPNLEIHFDMQRSGAMIAYDYFQPLDVSADVQELYRYTQDADLWTWKLPDSKAFHAGLVAARIEYNARENPMLWEELMQLNPSALKEQGRKELAVQDRKRKQVLETAFPIKLLGPLADQKGLGIVLDDEDELGARIRSTLGNDLAQEAASRPGLTSVGIVAYREAGMPKSQIKLSLRSIGGVDVSTVAESFGGGGHAAAASGVLALPKFEQLLRM